MYEIEYVNEKEFRQLERGEGNPNVIYFMKNNGTYYRYLHAVNKYGEVLGNAKNGYYQLTGIGNLKAIYSDQLYTFFGVTNDNKIYKYNCPLSGTTCTGTLTNFSLN